jgi:hypothetical protein
VGTCGAAGTGAMDKPTVTFDQEGKVRVLDEDKFKHTVELEKECRNFVTSASAVLGA